MWMFPIYFFAGYQCSWGIWWPSLQDRTVRMHRQDGRKVVNMNWSDVVTTQISITWAISRSKPGNL